MSKSMFMRSGKVHMRIRSYMASASDADTIAAHCEMRESVDLLILWERELNSWVVWGRDYCRSK